jgi:lysophospholipase
MHKTPPKRWAFAGLFALASLATQAQPAASPFFPPLETATNSGTPPYTLHTEPELRSWPTWTDIEAACRQHADMTRGAFAGAQGVTIHYRLYQHRNPTRGSVIISAGRTEGLALYQETIVDLVRNGYSVYIHDHRGQGFSQRLLESDTTIGHVDEFEHYVQDLASFINGPVNAAHGPDGAPLFLLAHSMGGAVASLYLEGPHDKRIAAAALVTPMMEPWVASGSQPGLATRLADTYCEQYSTRHRGPLGRWLSQRYAQGGPFDDEYATQRLAPPDAPNDLTHSALRFTRHWDTRDQARCVGEDCGSAHAKVGGVSYRWFNQACMASQQARGPAAANITVPVLLLQGENDTVVKPAAQKEFCRHLNEANGSGYCVGRTVVQARHAILIESDTYRLPAMASVLGFFDCVRSGKRRCE